jgi:hypothetical protein
MLIDEEDVLVAVLVVVEEGAAGAHRLGEQLLCRGTVAVREVKAGLAGDLDESHGRRARRLVFGLRWGLGRRGRCGLPAVAAAEGEQNGESEHGK